MHYILFEMFVCLYFWMKLPEHSLIFESVHSKISCFWVLSRASDCLWFPVINWLHYGKLFIIFPFVCQYRSYSMFHFVIFPNLYLENKVYCASIIIASHLYCFLKKWFFNINNNLGLQSDIYTLGLLKAKLFCN